MNRLPKKEYHTKRKLTTTSDSYGTSESSSFSASHTNITRAYYSPILFSLLVILSLLLLREHTRQTGEKGNHMFNLRHSPYEQAISFRRHYCSPHFTAGKICAFLAILASYYYCCWNVLPEISLTMLRYAKEKDNPTFSSSPYSLFPVLFITSQVRNIRATRL